MPKNARVEKIPDKANKERIRGGTKTARLSLPVPEPEGVQEYINRIICGDAGRVLQLIPDESVDIIITSPPYNFGHSYARDPHDDTQDWNVYFSTLSAIWEECVRALKPGGRMAVNIQPLFSDYIPTHHLISSQLLRLGLLWKAEILWEKNNYNAKYTAWGSWRSPSMPYLKYTWEFIEVFDKMTHKKAGNREDIDISDEEFKEWVFGRWVVPPEIRMKEFGHPAMFPEEIPRRLLKLFSFQHDLVLDPFNGVGTTTLAAWKTNRRFIGIDISSEYCQEALARIRRSGLSAEGRREPDILVINA
jgi:site-specific DNA-methyltransferase (adenine-specific)